MKKASYKVILASGRLHTIRMLDEFVYRCAMKDDPTPLYLTKREIDEHDVAELDENYSRGYSWLDSSTGTYFIDEGDMFHTFAKIGTPIVSMMREDGTYRTKRYVVETITDEKGCARFCRRNIGYNAFELVGILDHAKYEVLSQINGKFAPDTIKREVMEFDIEDTE